MLIGITFLENGKGTDKHLNLHFTYVLKNVKMLILPVYEERMLSLKLEI